MQFRRIRVVGAVAAVLLLTACSGGDDVATDGGDDLAGGDATPVADGDDEGISGDEGDVEPIDGGGDDEPADGGGDGGPQLVCEDPDPVEIGLGHTWSDAIDVDGAATRCAWVEVPDGLDALTVTLSGLEADLRLGVGYGWLHSVQYLVAGYWSEQEAGTAEETVAIPDPPAGPYILEVSPGAFDAASPFTVQVTGDPPAETDPTGGALPGTDACDGPATVVQPGTPVDDEVVAGADDTTVWRYFCVEVPDGTASLTASLSGLEGHLDLLVRPAGASWVAFDRSRGPERSATVDGPSPGPFYIEIAPALSGAASPFTLEVGLG